MGTTGTTCAIPTAMGDCVPCLNAASTGAQGEWGNSPGIGLLPVATYVATTKFQPTDFLQLGHFGNPSPTAKVTRSWSAQSVR
jgi:hypothetical protein